ncbi:hypothetical protein PVAP13_2NG561120 [Panicum virgatum]|uniref:Uncharacterized protein n=1 Tax=Panicum virgatum TaxID=38727 RepID=A0A8T0VS38_PANVG|nr:hypothetical protein PVAP13_2NG561120 [Panicum virgatum]
MERQVGLPRWRRCDGLLGAASVCVVRACAARGRRRRRERGRQRVGSVGCGSVRAGDASERGGAAEASRQPKRAASVGLPCRRGGRAAPAARPMLEQRRKGWKGSVRGPTRQRPRCCAAEWKT